MNKVNILIVDDREENIIALEALIKRDDIHIISTTSPNDALKLAWENNISIALIDVQMPGMDGFELVEVLKSNPRTKDILVIFVTAISKESKYAVKGLASGAIDYLYKPLDPVITSAKVDSFIQLAKAQLEISAKNNELAKFAVIVNNCCDIICLVDAKSRQIQQINPPVTKILGYETTEIVDQPLDIIIPAEFKDQFELELPTENSAEHIFEFQLKNKAGEKVWTECRVVLKDNNYFFNISDHTIHKTHHEELINAREEAIQAKNIKERFLANMSHELRTPLNGIIGISHLLKQTILEEQQLNMVNLLELSSQSLLGVVNDILDITKIDSGKLVIVKKEINLRSTLKSVIELLKIKAYEKLIDLILEIDEDISEYVEADPLRLNQILMNLLSNAIKFTQKGYVKVIVSSLNKSEDNIKILFKVVDTGIGIPAESKDKIFESYEQADDETSLKYGGTGLGLAIVKKLVNMLGGEISFTSEVGVGSSFNIELEFKTIKNTLDNFSKILSNPLSSLKGLKILVAEDNMINQFMIKKILQSWEIEAEIVDNGLKVINNLIDNDYDIILMDTYMPEMGGFETTQKIRSEFKGDKQKIKIISLSAAIIEEEKKAALDAGMDYVLTKPFLPEELHRVISKAIEKTE